MNFKCLADGIGKPYNLQRKLSVTFVKDKLEVVSVRAPYSITGICFTNFPLVQLCA